jgi:hypothetical protein
MKAASGAKRSRSMDGQMLCVTPSLKASARPVSIHKPVSAQAPASGRKESAGRYVLSIWSAGWSSLPFILGFRG